MPRIVKNQGAPFTMLPATRILMLIQGRSVKSSQTIRVFRKMRRNPVHYHADIILVAQVDKIHKVLGRAVTTGQSVHTNNLVAPTRQQWVFG